MNINKSVFTVTPHARKALQTSAATQVDDPTEGLGTLSARAERAEMNRARNQFDVAAEDIRGRVSSGAALEDVDALSMSELLQDVIKFSALIDDRKIVFRQLTARFDESDALAAHIRCDGQAEDSAGARLSGDFDGAALVMRPTRSFFDSVARYANTNARVRALSGAFLDSLYRSPDAAGKREWRSLMDLLFGRLSAAFYRKTKGAPGASHKRVLLRMLRGDPTGRWAKQRSCRAILHEGYRDDISHEWLATRISELVPNGSIVRYFFNGNLLKGAVLVPEITRKEQDSEYGGGILVFSGEVGNRRAGMMPFVYRAVSSSIVIPGTIWGVAHTATPGLAELRSDMVSEMHRQLPLVTTALEQMLEARKVVFSEDDVYTVERLLIALSSSLEGLAKRDIRLWYVGVETERRLVPGFPLSAFTLQAGLVRMSQSIEDVVRQLQVEQLAGDLLSFNWGDIIQRAKTVSDSQVEKTFQRETRRMAYGR